MHQGKEREMNKQYKIKEGKSAHSQSQLEMMVLPASGRDA